MKLITLAACALLLAAPALAQAPPTPDAKLAMARAVVARVLPPGGMQKMMRAVMEAVPAQTMNQMMDRRLADFAGMAGTDAATLKNQLGDATLRQIMTVADPAFEERQRRTMVAMGNGMAAVMGSLEPELREGMAQAYASSFTPEELAAAHDFYRTALGGAVAAKSMLLVSDPAYLKMMEGLYPKMMQAMPAMIADVQKATADLPPPRKMDQLSKAEREQLLALIKPGK